MKEIGSQIGEPTTSYDEALLNNEQPIMTNINNEQRQHDNLHHAHDFDRQATPRELAVIEEVPTPVSYQQEDDAEAPPGPPQNQTPISKSGWLGKADVHSLYRRRDVNDESHRPIDGDDPQTQPFNEFVKELFYFFLRRDWKKKALTTLSVLLCIPLFLDIFVFRSGYVTGYIDTFLDWMAVYPFLGSLAYVLILTLTSLIFIPPSILIFAAGFTFQNIWGSFGIFVALVASFLGSLMGGLLGYLRAKYMTRDLIKVLMKRYPLIKAVDAAIVKNGFRVMVLMRLNCLIPFSVLNYVFGVTGVDWMLFLLAMVGVLPWHLLLICLGASAETMYDEHYETSLIGAILIGMGIASGIIGLVVTWKFAKKELQKVRFRGVV